MSNNIIFFDTETTGLPDPATKWLPSAINTHLWPYVIQIAYVVFDPNTQVVVKEVNRIINLPQEVIIPEDSIKIHGITRGRCNEEGVSIEKALLEFFEDVKQVKQVVAHNIEFDLNMIKTENYRILKTMPKNMEFLEPYASYTKHISKTKKTCTMKTTKDLCKIERQWDDGTKYNKYPSLLELHQHLFNETPSDLHDALIDVKVCMKCFCKITYQKEKRD